MDEVATPTTQPISDDQELAKALAGVTEEANNLNFEETPVSTPPVEAAPAETAVVESAAPVEALPTFEVPTIPQTDASDSDLDGIKKDALLELRPLLDKLNLAPEEKFDIYLLLLRNTDDKTLIAPAHTTAQEIADETRRAQALLDIIKEIDYLSGSSAQAAL